MVFPLVLLVSIASCHEPTRRYIKENPLLFEKIALTSVVILYSSIMKFTNLRREKNWDYIYLTLVIIAATLTCMGFAVIVPSQSTVELFYQY